MATNGTRRSARLAARQHGVITRSQLVGCGRSEGSIRNDLESGRLTVARPGVYLLAGSSPSWRQAVSVACTWGGEGTYASHLTAARLWALAGFHDNEVHISTTRNLRTGGGVTVHLVRKWSSCDVARAGGFPVTSSVRTLMDVAATCPVDRIEIALDDALRRGIVTLRRLSWRLDEVGARGRAGAAPLRRLLIARAEGCAPAHSPLETRFARLLRAAGLPPPHRQFEIYDGDCFVARVDFAYPEHGLVIELDDYGYHSGRVEWEKDLMRRNHIESAGYRVLHITARRMNEDPEGVVALVRSLMDPRLPF